MDHRRLQQQQKSKYGGGLGRKTIGVPPHPAPARRSDVGGNDQFRRRMNYSKINSDSSSSNGSCIEENSFTCDSQQNSYRKACGRPIKALIREEMSREKETRQSSPSVIAKLMGLDTMPPAQVLDKQQKDYKDMRSYSRKTCAEDISHRRRNSEQEFKDVFEIKDSVKVEKNRNQPPCKGAPWSKRNETDVAFIKQKFMEAKRLSTNETLQNSKEFNDALEVLDSNKDLFLQFLQEPNSFFSKRLNDLKCFSPSPRESHITILRSSKGKKHEMAESSSSSEAKVESSGYMHNDAVSSCRKPINGLVNHSLTENGVSLSHKLLMSRNANKTKSSSHPTQIVVLNPSLEKAQNMARIASPTISHENHQYGFTRHRRFRQSGVKELHAEGRERQKLFDNLEVMGHKIKGSREIAREITKQMGRSVSSSGQMPFSGSDNLFAVSGRYSSNKFETYQWTPNYDYRSSYSSSSSSSTESTVSKEARKRLSERWRMAHRLREARLTGRGSNTLGEMLDLSVRGTTRETLMSKKVSDEKLARGSLGTRFYPSGISSRDGWKGGCSKHLSRSSLSSSSTTHGTPNLSSRQHIGVNDRCYMLKDVLNLGADGSLPGKLNQRGNYSCRSSKSRSFKSHSLNSGGEENRPHVREIHMCKDKLRNETTSTSYSETKPILTKSSLTTNFTPGNQVNCSSVESIDTEVPFNTDEGHIQQGRQDGEFSGNIHTGTNKTLEETFADNPRVDSRHNQRDRTDPESHKSAEEVEQPSPVSVLDLPYEEKSSPESFERVNAGLQGLRMQLRLLRLGKSDTFGKECETRILIEDETEYCSSPEQKPEMLQTFRNEEERDFSYLLDILVDSGIHGAKQDGLFDACYSMEHQVHPGIFEKLENKYGGLGGWMRSERKLFFDLINSILAEILSPFMGLHPWIKPEKRNLSVWSHERLFEEVWQMVARQRKEPSAGNNEVKILDTRWLFLGDDVDMIGREIECILEDDLMDELVSDFIFG